MDKKIDTLVDDIYTLFLGHACDDERVQKLGERIAQTVSSRLADYAIPRDPTLRMSNLGKPDRQLWYDIHYQGRHKEELSPSTRFKFLYGDILELLLLFLAEEAGHKVEMQQAEVEVNGVKGHIDAVIDGVLVDAKSTSTHSFRKFKNGELQDSDPFGYYDQLAGYSRGLGGIDAGWLAVDKQNGHITFLSAPKEELDALQIEDRIDHIRNALSSSDPPERCYDPEPVGTSGNLALSTGCSYCSHKFHCWSDANNGVGLRTFLYAKGPTHMVHVEKEPNVLEITF